MIIGRSSELETREDGAPIGQARKQQRRFVSEAAFMSIGHFASIAAARQSIMRQRRSY
jgi:hypothetical protein